MDKANEWLTRLHKQDIMLVGDLRELQDEDWAGLGLTVFATRALKNALSGKPIRVPGQRPLQRSMTGTSASGLQSVGLSQAPESSNETHS
jgi:WNK lysine deficient protein kinase